MAGITSCSLAILQKQAEMPLNFLGKPENIFSEKKFKNFFRNNSA